MARETTVEANPGAAAPVPPPADVVVGLSGGVDSSVAALLLTRQGLRVRGVFMKNWEEDDRNGFCSAAEDLADARAVSEWLGIALSTVNFSSEYWERVFREFLAELRAGRTPNPDVLCNREIKFKAFLDYALSLGAERIATGHYARIRARDGRYELWKGADPGKDQSYFLYLLDQRALSRSLFPLGELSKDQVRRLAREAGLKTHAKRDSTGICFIGEHNFKQFLSRYLRPRPGPMRTPEGTLLGEHDGLAYYTLGQRKGLGIGGRRGGDERPWYVVGKDAAENALIVARGHDHPWLYSRALETERAHWVAGEAPPMPMQCSAKTRYRQADQSCRVEALEAGRLEVRFGEPQWAVTPGQSVVFYAGRSCLGGAVIRRASSASVNASSAEVPGLEQRSPS